ncbi:hypothetical protein [Flavobacterium sp. KMS]|uniref:hypothetical protein n=1 Tax=Flavobacterium sp. KMS TaxID=1566023 RepID=UPI00103D10CA|nr:hypothetical protein [Flavobacterium sp. KMS]
MPFGTREFTAILGLIGFIIKKIFELERHNNVFLTNNIIKIYFVLMLLSFISLISLTANSSSEIEYIKYSITVSTIIFGSYLLYLILIKVHHFLSFQIIANYIIAVVLFQVILSLLMFIFPTVNTFFLNIQVFNEMDVSVIEQTVELRLIGFGARFFGAGLVNAYALILISFAVSFSKNKKELLFYAFSFLIIFVIGMMMARTTLIGFILSLFVLLLSASNTSTSAPKLKSKKYFLGYIFYFVLLLVLIVWVITLFIPKVLEILQVASNFGFEIFINYFENGTAESASTDMMQEMYVWPQKEWTYIFGDGRFYSTPGDPSGGYYMGIDIGYIRLLYYFGISGLITFYWLQFIAIQMLGKTFFKKPYMFIIIMSLFVLILGGKGLADLLYLNLIWGVLWIDSEKFYAVKKQ